MADEVPSPLVPLHADLRALNFSLYQERQDVLASLETEEEKETKRAVAAAAASKKESKRKRSDLTSQLSLANPSGVVQGGVFGEPTSTKRLSSAGGGRPPGVLVPAVSVRRQTNGRPLHGRGSRGGKVTGLQRRMARGIGEDSDEEKSSVGTDECASSNDFEEEVRPPPPPFKLC